MGYALGASDVLFRYTLLYLLPVYVSKIALGVFRQVTQMTQCNTVNHFTLVINVKYG